MSRDYFIIMVYVLVCENYQALVAQCLFVNADFHQP